MSARHWPTQTLVLALVPVAAAAHAWTPVPVADDPLVRMPGTQPADGVMLDDAGQCDNCHDGYDPNVDPGFFWRGTMMAQAARDPLFWAGVAVAAQDSIWATGRPNAADLCLRCHTPGGWLEVAPIRQTARRSRAATSTAFLATRVTTARASAASARAPAEAEAKAKAAQAKAATLG